MPLVSVHVRVHVCVRGQRCGDTRGETDRGPSRVLETHASFNVIMRVH